MNFDSLHLSAFGWGCAGKCLIAACRDYGERAGRKVFFEWMLIEGKSDSPRLTEALGKLLSGMHAHGLAAAARGGGSDVAAGYGQLRAEKSTRRLELPRLVDYLCTPSPGIAPTISKYLTPKNL